MRTRFAVPRTVAVLALIVALAGAMDLLAASTAQAQDNYKTLTRLGGGNRFDPPLKDAVAVQKWAAKKRTQTAIADVLGKAGLSSLNATVIDILTKASPDQLKDTRVPARHDDGLDGVPPRRRPAGHRPQREVGRQEAVPGLHVRHRRPEPDLHVRPAEAVLEPRAGVERAEPREGAPGRREGRRREGRCRQGRRREGRRRARPPRGRAPRA